MVSLPLNNVGADEPCPQLLAIGKRFFINLRIVASAGNS